MTAQCSQAPYFIEHQPGKGTIARYHLDTAEITDCLAAIRAGGADGISLSLWLMKNAVALGAGDTYLDWDGAGNLTLQMQTNLENLLAAIKAAGFNWVQLAPTFWNENDPRKNPWPSMDLAGAPPYYTGNWLFLGSLPALCTAAGLAYIIDVCPECNDVWDTNPGLQLYGKRVWMDTTTWFYQGGEPCWNFSVSFIPGNYKPVTALFQGNPAAILLPHIYGTEQQAVYDGLQAVGLWDRPWIVGECLTLNQPQDASLAQSWVSFIQKTKQEVVRLCPWQIDARAPNGTQLNVWPPQASKPWADCGF